MSESGERRSPGFLLVLVATALVGVAGYVITWLVPRAIGVGPYASFAVFWSALFLAIAALSGIQQETTRATIPRVPGQRAARPALFAAGAALASAAAIAATSPLWASAVFGARTALLWPLVTGCASYVFLAALAGTLYAASHWRLIFALMTIEGVGRLLAIGLTLVFSHDPFLLAWAACAPIPLAVLIVGVLSRTVLGDRFQVDAGYRTLAWNSARTVAAAAAMGVLVSGFPLLLTVTSPHASPTALGLLLLVSTLTRSPLIVVAMALQSYLIVFFRQSPNPRRALSALLGLALAAGGVLGVLGLLLGEAVFSLLFPGQPVPPAWLIAVLVATSALVAAICVSAPAVLVQGNHTVFTAGWIAAAGATALALLLPGGLFERASLAVAIGPAAGLAVHLIYLFGRRAPLSRDFQGESGADTVRP
ncbi:hypothetical protein ATY41_07375 [Leifsonia xyli subsp. xyli]|uniref:Uncharacterized protein n=1 Tax=Leifsonia xyli subsp. xyli TaxID=59736 RepID=A0A1E2SMG9_LEIXY|nr:hypothetical protein [Leifsonia xyli]ODA91036.1 hypothetical protein ATY41_07375 [Leifsonia xyli subsp. xyli]